MELPVIISICISIIALIVAILSLRLGWKRLHILKKQDLEATRKEMETKRREVWELQPRLKVTSRCNFQPKMHIENMGNSPAKNIVVTIDGSEAKVEIDSLRAKPTGLVNYKVVKLKLSSDDPICIQMLENPKLKVVFHDQWISEQDYPVIKLPFKQESLGTEEFRFRPNFDRSKQNPPWEQTTFSGYSDEQILEIWNRVNLGK